MLRLRRRLRPRHRLRRARAKIRHRRLQRRLAGRRVMKALAASRPNAFFVEIGSNDGEQLDHLHETIVARPWRGVMVEPLPHVFERLRRNYAGNPRVRLEQAAISERDGTRPFFHLRPVADPGAEGLPSWYDAIGSFSRDHVLSHDDLIPGIEERIEEVAVPCLSFDSLCRRHGIERIDVLQIDAEGHDLQILAQVDLARHRPALIIYEHYHLSPSEQAGARERLEAAGYRLMEEGLDTWCLDEERAGPDVARVWSRARPGLPPLFASTDESRGQAGR